MSVQERPPATLVSPSDTPEQSGVSEGSSGRKRSAPGSNTLRWQNRLALAALAGPALFWFLVFMIGPLISMFYLSLLDWRGLLASPSFTGFGNFAYLFTTDPTFPAAVRNTIVHLCVVLPLMLLPAFMLGYFLSMRPPGYRLLGVLFFTPALMSASARAMMFAAMYAPDGIINASLRTFGLGSLARVWLADTSTALGSIIAVDLWSGIGFTGTIFAARLASISSEIYEAADLDGANHWTKLWRIAFPMARDFFGVMTMLQFLWLLLGSAQNVLLLTKGGPGRASTTLGFMLYDEAFVTSRLGYSQAIGVLLFSVSLISMLLIRRTFRQTY
jgi:multiple sugar transport system permease protein